MGKTLLSCTLIILIGLSFVDSMGMDMDSIVKKMTEVFSQNNGGMIKQMCTMIQSFMASAGADMMKNVQKFMGMESSKSLPIDRWLEQCKTQGVSMKNIADLFKGKQ